MARVDQSRQQTLQNELEAHRARAAALEETNHALESRVCELEVRIRDCTHVAVHICVCVTL